jgi:hypothetical protein
MHYACFCGHGDAVLMLLEGGGDPNKVGDAMLTVGFVVCAVTIPGFCCPSVVPFVQPPCPIHTHVVCV